MLQPSQQHIIISLDKQVRVSGELRIPGLAKGVVIFPQDDDQLAASIGMVADYLVQQGFATLLFQLPHQDADHLSQSRFDVRRQAEQLVIVSEWLLSFEKTTNYHQAYFGFNAGAAAAIYAAGAEGNEIAAIVACGGRFDVAMEVLPTLQAPTLIIVGSNDREVLQLNQKVFEMMHCPKRLEIIPEASNQFKEKGGMEKVCMQALSWFEQYLHPIRMLSD